MTGVTTTRPVSYLQNTGNDPLAALRVSNMTALSPSPRAYKPQLLLRCTEKTTEQSAMSNSSSPHRLKEFNLEGFFHHFILYASRLDLQQLPAPAQPSSQGPFRSRSIKRVDRHRPPSRSTSGPRNKKQRSQPITATPVATSVSKPPHYQYRTLSSWNQTAPRGHVRMVLCFELDDHASLSAIENHLTASLRQAAKSQPEFAGSLVLDSSSDPSRKGRLLLRLSDSDSIPLLVEDARDSFGMTFSQLRATGFSADAFVGPRYSTPGSIVEGGEPVPVAVIKAVFVDGGLLLLTYLHHTLADGTAVARFLDHISSHTRGVITASELELDLPESDDRIKRYMEDKTEEELFEMCPEFSRLETRTGPTQPRLLPGGASAPAIERTGRIFRFKKYKLDALQAILRMDMHQDINPSTYTTLAGLAWAHITKARLEAEHSLASEQAKSRPARLMNPVNWKKRALPGTTDRYFGNATALSFTTVPVSQLEAAAQNMTALASLVRDINESINSIDDDFVCKRTALFRQMADSRNLGLELDPRTPQDLGFNTWRHFGGDTEWTIPGIKTTRPEAIRRAQDTFNFGGALILPAQASSDVQELLITLPTASMERLIQDRKFMAWVEDVVA